MKEVDLDHAFADALKESAEFQSWLLAGGRFSRHAKSAKLLHDEQGKIRKAKHWWKHWWCKMPDGSEGETDVFAVFESQDCKRFALHIENKPPKGVLLFPQAANYRPRAAFKTNDPRWLNYCDFEVIIMAPEKFLASHADCAQQFDRSLTYEAISDFVPIFIEALKSS